MKTKNMRLCKNMALYAIFLLLLPSNAKAADPITTEDCETSSLMVVGSLNFFPKKEYGGLVARKKGERFFVFDKECYVLSHSDYNKNSIEFVVNNNVDSESEGFFGIQILRIQIHDQIDTSLTFERKGDGWFQNKEPALPLPLTQFTGLKFNDFNRIHGIDTVEKFDSKQIKSSSGVFWHADGPESKYSSYMNPKLWIDHQMIEFKDDPKALLSNRLYSFKPGATPTSFRVGLDGTERFYLRVFSSLPDTQPKTIEIRFKRK